MALAVAMVPLVMLGGCGESNHKDLQEEHHTPGLASTLPKDGQVAEQGPAREEDHWPLPLYPLAPPPAAGGPEIPPDKSPSIYTDARIGMRTVMKIYSDDGRSTLKTTEVYNVDRTTVHARQTVQSDVGEYTYDLAYNRFSTPSDARWGLKGKIVGAKLLKVGGKTLLCDIYEDVHNGRFTYRTLRCRDILGWTVRHSDNAAGTWKTRLELIDFRE